MGRKVNPLIAAVAAALLLPASAVAQGAAAETATAAKSDAATKTRAAAKTKGAPNDIKFVTADQVQFDDAPGMKGVQTAQLWGDMSKNGDWGALFKFEAGTDVGWHSHSGAIHLVVLSGTLSIEPEGGQPVELQARAFASEPARVKHRTTCQGTEDCVFFLHMEKKFDFKKAEARAASR